MARKKRYVVTYDVPVTEYNARASDGSGRPYPIPEDPDEWDIRDLEAALSEEIATADIVDSTQS